MNRAPPVMSLELARQIEQMDIYYSVSRMGGMQTAQGNPLGIQIKSYGNTVAFLIKAWPDFWYGQKVLGLSTSDGVFLDEIVQLFRHNDLSCRFEIIPGNLDESLAIKLNQLGFLQVGFSTALYGCPKLSLQARPEGIAVQPVSPAQIDHFIDLYQDCFEYPRLVENEKKVVRWWIEGAQHKLDCYIASIGDSPAGIGILFSHGKVSLLADAAVLPRYRTSGCHTALIQRRIDRAAERGCELITSFPAFGSNSHRNLERAGLRIAYTKTMWYERKSEAR
jgi:GNAT superfamily N-acetyltransferase